MSETCHEHTGCLRDIDNLKCDQKKIWGTVQMLDNRVDSIMTRLNVILGSIVVSVILVLINMLLKVV